MHTAVLTTAPPKPTVLTKTAQINGQPIGCCISLYPTFPKNL